MLGKKHKVLNNFFDSHSLYWNRSVDIYVGDAKDKVSKTAGTLA